MGEKTLNKWGAQGAKCATDWLSDVETLQPWRKAANIRPANTRPANTWLLDLVGEAEAIPARNLQPFEA